MGKTAITAGLKKEKYKMRRGNQSQISGRSWNIVQLSQCPFGALYQYLSAVGKFVRHLFEQGKWW